MKRRFILMHRKSFKDEYIEESFNTMDELLEEAEKKLILQILKFKGDSGIAKLLKENCDIVEKVDDMRTLLSNFIEFDSRLGLQMKTKIYFN